MPAQLPSSLRPRTSVAPSLLLAPSATATLLDAPASCNCLPPPAAAKLLTAGHDFAFLELKEYFAMVWTCGWWY
ncbi:hypothetical protein BRADI_3g22426v3 [Brachypodium distachyon]|uniref:Uncharacterized protein n=1 Tax=Brachypodium distachyon TaxID=15368 RepID=A0A2K2CYU0_BRADI|nr:hypothetical protein BRADI_3g22426v3 [Brachypodium distachyon]